ncbi:MAG: hypothetical protein KGI71_06190 [Patescibacteria group bacterium]|nr:hypothetical protein [Patescibacteria group bacterium]
MLYGGIAAVVGIIVAVGNFLSAASSITRYGNRSMGSIVGVHIIGGLLYGGGGLTFVLGFILYIVHLIKG